jgi:hypothetical protein
VSLQFQIEGDGRRRWRGLALHGLEAEHRDRKGARGGRQTADFKLAGGIGYRRNGTAAAVGTNHRARHRAAARHDRTALGIGQSESREHQD